MKLTNHGHWQLHCSSAKCERTAFVTVEVHVDGKPGHLQLLRVTELPLGWAWQQEERGTGPILTNPLCDKCAPR